MEHARWVRIAFSILICGIILLPFVPLFLASPKFTTLLPVATSSHSNQKTSNRYSVQNQMPGYTLALVDTNYLDFAIAKMHIYEEKAIVDPRFYQGFSDITIRYTISRVRFVLVKSIDRPVSTVVRGDGRTTPLAIVGQGNYSAEGDTLVVRVALNFDVLNRGLFGKFALEDAFLQTAVDTLYYAQGSSDAAADQKALVEVKQDIQDYLYKEVFVWPFRIV